MKLLIVTQKVDKRDSGVLGFFHGWIEEFSKHFEFVTVVCLERGEYSFAPNVKVLSLGKENGRSKLKYIRNFYRYVWDERANYDAVFVHMNQEYVLLAGLWWRVMGKKVLLWRNHKMGSLLTRLAVYLSHRVYCTSPDSYTAKFKKTRIMPTGIDLTKLKADRGIQRIPNSILSLGRIGKVKNIDLLIEALLILDKKDLPFSATIVGDTDPGSEDYKRDLIRRGALLVDKDKLRFGGGVPNTDTPNFYQSHELFVNMTNSGSMDKTIFSAMTSGALVVVCNRYFENLLPKMQVFREGDAEDLADKIEQTLSMREEDKKKEVESMKKYVNENHGLERLVEMVKEDLV